MSNNEVIKFEKFPNKKEKVKNIDRNSLYNKIIILFIVIIVILLLLVSTLINIKYYNI